MATRRRRGRIRTNPSQRGKTRATTKKTRSGKLSIPDLAQQKRNAHSTKRKRQLQFALNMRRGKFRAGRRRR